MVVIRLSRGGAKKRPFYHLVVIDKRRSRNSRFIIEQIGYFNPIASGKDVRLNINMERLQHWIACGAQPSDRVKSLASSYKSTESSASIRPVETQSAVSKGEQA